MKNKSPKFLVLTTILLTLLGISLFSVLLTRAHAQEALTGDLDDDGDVDGIDFGIFAPCYGSIAGDPKHGQAYKAIADLDHDGDVDGVDFGIFAPNYGTHARAGTGILYARVKGSSEKVEMNAAGNYLVYPGGNYEFNITGITEYTKTKITVWARYKVGDTTYNINITAHRAPNKTPFDIQKFNWTVPSDIPVTTSIKFKYGTDYDGPAGTWYYATKDLSPSPRLLLVVPETFLGSLGAIAALFAGLKIKSFVRKKKQHSS